MKRPAFQFYPGDWMNDVALRSVSLSARGLWIELICLMHQGTPYGHLTINGKGIKKDILPTVLSRILGADPKGVMDLLTELRDAGVFSETPEGVIYSKRMVRDEEIRAKRSEGGCKSLEHKNVPRPKDILNGYPPRISLDPPLGGSPSSSSSSSNKTQGKFDASEFGQAELLKAGWSKAGLAAWDSWAKHRRQLRHGLTQLTCEKQIAELKEMGERRGMAAIDHSIKKGWQGLFEAGSQSPQQGFLTPAKKIDYNAPTDPD